MTALLTLLLLADFVLSALWVRAANRDRDALDLELATLRQITRDRIGFRGHGDLKGLLALVDAHRPVGRSLGSTLDLMSAELSKGKYPR